MSNDNIFNIAIEAGMEIIHEHELRDADWICHSKDIIKFYQLAIQQERNRLAAECEQLPFGDTAHSFSTWIKNGGVSLL